MRVFKAPQKIDKFEDNIGLFLAGSIDMGSAIDWQKQVTDALSDYPVDIYNPRRDDWDSSWKQSIDNAKFREQVEWELNAQQNCADLICFYFDPKGHAPITLLELGLAHSQEIVVCCPEGYFRKGNVDVTCAYYGIPTVDNLEELIDYLKNHITGQYEDDQYF